MSEVMERDIGSEFRIVNQLIHRKMEFFRMEDQCIIHVSDHAQGFVPGFLGGQSLIHPFLGNVEGLVELPGKCSSVLYENLVFPFLFVCTLRFSIYRIKC